MSTAKGDELEEKVLRTFQQLIDEDKFYARKECCRIFRKKGYFSGARKSDIIFDISIEITLPGHDGYSHLILIECKNLARKVPIDDIEEFFSKTQQITPGNTKAIIVSNSAFQDGVLRFASSQGIGLARCFASDSLEWVLKRSPSAMDGDLPYRTYSGPIEAITEQSFRSRYFDFYFFVGDGFTNSINRFFSRLLRSRADRESTDGLLEIENAPRIEERLVPFIEKSSIEERAQSILKKIGHVEGPVSLSAICERLSGSRGLTVVDTTLDPGVLGTIAFSPLAVQLDRAQARTLERARFTLAHELGHLFMKHERYMYKDVCRSEDIELEKNVDIGTADIARMEVQANYFASCLLVPRTQLFRSATKNASEAGLFNRGHGLIYLDSQACNSAAFYAMSAPLIREFEVSRSVLKIRLREIGLLVDGSVGPQRLEFDGLV